MSQVKVHNIRSLTRERRLIENIEDLPLGTEVGFYMDPHSYGIVVEKLNNDEVQVLWAKLSNPFEAFVRPLTRNYTQIAQQMFTVQPMPQSTALPFYLDNMFDKKEEK